MPKGATVSPSETSGLPAVAAAKAHCRFGRAARLLKPAEYAAVFAARQHWRGRLFSLHQCHSALLHPRLGLVIPKKFARNAVTRNAIKRQAREAFRLRQASLPPCDYVLRLVAPATRRDKPVWRSEIEQLFARAAVRGAAS